MLHDYDRLIFGGTPLDRGLIQFTTDEFGATRAEEIDVDNLTFEWTVDAYGNEFEILRGGDGGQTKLRIDDDLVRVTDDLRVAGDLQDVAIDASDNIQIHQFTNEASIRRSSGDSDEIAIIDRHGNADYDIEILQGGTRERIFTTTDDGSFDAATLDGRPSSEYAELDQNETVSGTYNFTSQPTYNSDVLATEPWVDAGYAPDPHGNEDHTETFATEGYVDDSLVDVDDSGTSVATSVAHIDFGEDLEATVSGDGVLVDNIVSDIPSEVYEDGTLVMDNANGVDFVNDFSVTEISGQIAEIAFDNDDLADTTANETVIGNWTFDGTLTYGTEDVATSGDLFSGSYNDLTDVPSTFTPEDHGDGAHTENYAAVDRAETITSDWTVDAHLDLLDNNLEHDGLWRQRYSSTMGALVVEQDGSVVSRYNDDGTVAFPSGLDGELSVDSIDVVNNAEVGANLDVGGGLEVLGGGVIDGDLDVGGDTTTEKLVFEDRADDNSQWVVIEGSGDGRLDIQSGGSSRIELFPDGDVEIPNGGLDVGGSGDFDGDIEATGDGHFAGGELTIDNDPAATEPHVDSEIGTHASIADAHHTRFSDSSGDSIGDIPNRDHSDLTGVGPSDHHTKYTDTEAVSAVTSEDPLSLSNDIEIPDATVVYRDLEADRTNHTPHDGAVFIATDTGAVYDGDGESWVKATRKVESLHAEEIDGNATAQTSPVTNLRDIGIVDAGQFDPSEWDDDALVAERE